MHYLLPYLEDCEYRVEWLWLAVQHYRSEFVSVRVEGCRPSFAHRTRVKSAMYLLTVAVASAVVVEHCAAIADRSCSALVWEHHVSHRSQMYRHSTIRNEMFKH